MKQERPQASDYSRYFSIRQKAYLINVSEKRDRDRYDSISGYIVSCRGNIIELQIPYITELEPPGAAVDTVTYKLTTESLGVGLQMVADLIQISDGALFQLQLRGSLEIYQRRQNPRIDISFHTLRHQLDHSLASYLKEFKRMKTILHTRKETLPATFKLQELPINLSAGGIRLIDDINELVSPLSMFFIDVQDNLPPVCAVAELVWNRVEDGKRISGYRFIHILKNDQERIGRCVQGVQKKSGMTATTPQVNWELMDRMTYELS